MVTAIIILSIIGLISATLLYIISRKFHVEEDSRIDEIESILPGIAAVADMPDVGILPNNARRSHR